MRSAETERVGAPVGGSYYPCDSSQGLLLPRPPMTTRRLELLGAPRSAPRSAPGRPAQPPSAVTRTSLPARPSRLPVTSRSPSSLLWPPFENSASKSRQG